MRQSGAADLPHTVVVRSVGESRHTVHCSVVSFVGSVARGACALTCSSRCFDTTATRLSSSSSSRRSISSMRFDAGGICTELGPWLVRLRLETCEDVAVDIGVSCRLRLRDDSGSGRDGCIGEEGSMVRSIGSEGGIERRRVEEELKVGFSCEDVKCWDHPSSESPSSDKAPSSSDSEPSENSMDKSSSPSISLSEAPLGVTASSSIISDSDALDPSQYRGSRVPCGA
jgi:hypothetical protein